MWEPNSYRIPKGIPREVVPTSSLDGVSLRRILFNYRSRKLESDKEGRASALGPKRSALSEAADEIIEKSPCAF
jgi:hypothetical protein